MSWIRCSQYKSPINLWLQCRNISAVHLTNRVKRDVKAGNESGRARGIGPLDVLLLNKEHIPPILVVLDVCLVLAAELLHALSNLLLGPKRIAQVFVSPGQWTDHWERSGKYQICPSCHTIWYSSNWIARDRSKKFCLWIATTQSAPLFEKRFSFFGL